MDAEELRRRGELVERGTEPHARAADDLLSAAEEALARGPRPEDPLHHRGPFLYDSKAAYALALAWVVTTEERYARGAAEFILAWVDGVDRTADTCPLSGGSNCSTSLLLSRSAPAFVFAADLLDGSGALSDEDEARLKRWLSTLVLPAASERTNNWGDAGVFMRVAVSDYIGDAPAFERAIDAWRDLMDVVTDEGQIPEETRRRSQGLLYSQGAVSFKVGAAVIAERRGIDLWSYEGSLGGTLDRAIDSVAQYMEAPRTWPWHSGRVKMPSVDPIWEIIYHRSPKPEYAQILADERPLGAGNPSAIIFTTLTHGEPLELAPTPRGD